MSGNPRCSGLSLLSGGLDSQLAVRVLERAGAHVEGITFSTPFFDCAAARKAAAALGIELHVVDFTDDEVALIENPPHGFGGAMNPCIDCHAAMIRRAGEMMAELGVVDYPSPAGGCKLTEEGFCRKLRDLKDHEGLGDRRLLELLVVGRRFRLPDGSSVILGRDRAENAVLRAEKGTVVAFDGVPGPTALVPVVKSEADLELARGIVRAWSRGGTGRERYRAFQIV